MLKILKKPLAAGALAAGICLAAGTAQAAFFVEAAVGTLYGTTAFTGGELGYMKVDDQGIGDTDADAGQIDTMFSLGGFDLGIGLIDSNIPGDPFFGWLTSNVNAITTGAGPLGGAASGVTLRIYGDYALPTDAGGALGFFTTNIFSDVTVDWRSALITGGLGEVDLGSGTDSTSASTTPYSLITAIDAPYTVLHEFVFSSATPNSLGSPNTMTMSTVVQPVPEPASAAIFGLGLLGLGALKRRKQRKAA